MIHGTLSQAAATIHQVDGLVALRGPGSFTGLRIGLGTVYGLHQALGIPAKGVSTLEVLATASPTDAVTIVAVVDALRGEWFVQSFAAGSPPEPHATPQCLTTESLGELTDSTIIGHGIRAALKQIVDSSTRIFEPASLAPTALLHCGEPGPEWDPETLTDPLYFRQPAATPARISKRNSGT